MLFYCLSVLAGGFVSMFDCSEAWFCASVFAILLAAGDFSFEIGLVWLNNQSITFELFPNNGATLSRTCLWYSLSHLI